jgi:nitric oxide reductase subunit C
VIAGKRIWERHSCINCHTILGEGAYFAPELGNVWVRYGGREDPASAREALKAWMQAMPSGVEGRRQMPQFNLTDQDLDELIDFLEWTSTINTQGWPPTTAG